MIHLLRRVYGLLQDAIERDEETVSVSVKDLRWLFEKFTPLNVGPAEDERPLVVPYGVLKTYPLALTDCVAAMWEIYTTQDPGNQSQVEFEVEAFLCRMGKNYSEKPLRELHAVFHQLYNEQHIGYTREYIKGVDTVRVYLTPDALKRAKAYAESLRPK